MLPNEEKIVNTIIDALLAKGYKLSINDGEQDFPIRETKAELIADMDSSDEDYIFAHKDGYSFSVWLIYDNGNEGRDLIANYSITLESVMAGVSEFVDTL